MNRSERLDFILSILKKQEIIKVSDVIGTLKLDRTTIYRDFKELVQEGKIEEVGKGKYALKKRSLAYFDVPFFERPKKTYNFDFLWNYRPNETNFFTREQLKILQNTLTNLDIDTDFYIQNRRLIETTLIDLSFASSYLEWNTYDYLDTEVLVKYNEIAKEKSADDTQMILNHKRCIEYMLHYKKELPYSKQTFFEIHSLLWEKLLPKEYLWVVRNRVVEIWASTYTPLDNVFQLEEQFEIFLRKLVEIQNPFEQSLFVLIFVPYFQVFMDINKRTSRMSANLPLLKHNLPLISFLAVNKRDYITAILAIYELNDTSLLRDIFVDNYILNMRRYI